MVQTKSGYKASGEPVTILQRHRRPPQAKGTTSTMTNTEDQPFGTDDLAAMVDKLSKDLEFVIRIRDQPPKAHVIANHRYLFEDKIGLQLNRVIEHEIQLVADLTLPNIGMYQNSVLKNAKIKRQVEELIMSGVIKPSSSPCGSPIILVPKKDGGYHKVRIREDDTWMTAFKTRQGLHESLVMSFGLRNAPATFMRLMNDILPPHIDDFVIVYLNDILIYSRTSCSKTCVLKVFEQINVQNRGEVLERVWVWVLEARCFSSPRRSLGAVHYNMLDNVEPFHTVKPARFHKFKRLLEKYVAKFEKANSWSTCHVAGSLEV
nr:hypothetical protein [Tanacetum cinerariifolium]